MLLSGSWALGAELRCMELACPSSGQGLEQSESVSQASARSSGVASLSAQYWKEGGPARPHSMCSPAGLLPYLPGTAEARGGCDVPAGLRGGVRCSSAGTE